MLDEPLARRAPADGNPRGDTHAPPYQRADAAKAVERWRGWVNEHRLAAAFLAALIATHLATVIGFWLPSVGLPRLDWPSTNGMVYLPHASSGVQFLTGGIFHYTDGLVFALLFAVLLHPAMPWRSTTLGNVLKGLTLGMILSVISCLWMMPRVYFPHAHAGFFSVNLGWKVILAVFVWHFVYGLHLGVIFNPSDRRPATS
jgi:hypothetical protein